MNTPLPVQVARLERHLDRLYALTERRRWRAAAVRGGRGAAGFAISLAALIKLKIVASLGGKLAVAALVALGVAWPMVGLVVLGLAAALAALIACEATDVPCDWPCRDCAEGRKRRDLLETKIADYEERLRQARRALVDVRRASGRAAAERL